MSPQRRSECAGLMKLRLGTREGASAGSSPRGARTSCSRRN